MFILRLIFVLLLSNSTLADNVDCSELFKNDREHQKVISDARKFQSNNESQLYWRNWIDDDVNYQRFINPIYYATQTPWKHAMEMYPNVYKQFLSFKDGNAFLNQIPKGEFTLSIDLIKTLHEKVMSGVYRLDEKIFDAIIPGDLFVAKAGNFKGHINFGFNPLTKTPLTETQYQAIMDNPYIKFAELPGPLSKPGKRRGLLVFPGRKTIEVEMEKLVEYYNTNKGKIDPIYLAATVQRRFVSLHPFYNGNGRTSRLLMNRILAEEGLHPSIIFDQNQDTYINNNPLLADELEWTEQVAKGMKYYQTLAKQTLAKFKKRVLYKSTPAIADKNLGTYLNEDVLKSNSDIISTDLFPSRPSAEFRINGERMILFKDGFFYNNKGVPHALHGNELYPISDKTYTLYGMNAVVDSQSRQYNKIHEQIFTDHLLFLKDIKEGVINPQNIKIHPYSLIADANNHNEYFLHPWQKELFLNAVDITHLPVKETLAPSRAQLTNYEKALFDGHKVSISEILAQYQRLDLEFRHYKTFAKKHFPEALPLIEKSREHLHKAGINFLDQFHERLSAIPVEEQELLKSHPKYQLYLAYLEYTPLSIRDYSAAMSKFENSYYLLRNDLTIYNKLGYPSENFQANLITRLPFSDKLIPALRKKFSEADKKSAQYAIYKKGLVNPYEFRGVDAEFERSLVDFKLQQMDDGRKEYVSFSSRADMYINSTGRFAFSSITNKEYTLNIVKLNPNKVHDNFASGWARQYELLKEGYTSPFRIVKVLKPEDFMKEGYLDLIDGKADKLLTKYWLFDLGE